MKFDVLLVFKRFGFLIADQKVSTSDLVFVYETRQPGMNG
jgi:hypothetical protein